MIPETYFIAGQHWKFRTKHQFSVGQFFLMEWISIVISIAFEVLFGVDRWPMGHFIRPSSWNNNSVNARQCRTQRDYLKQDSSFSPTIWRRPSTKMTCARNSVLHLVIPVFCHLLTRHCRTRLVDDRSPREQYVPASFGYYTWMLNWQLLCRKRSQAWQNSDWSHPCVSQRCTQRSGYRGHYPPRSSGVFSRFFEHFRNYSCFFFIQDIVRAFRVREFYISLDGLATEHPSCISSWSRWKKTVKIIIGASPCFIASW